MKKDDILEKVPDFLKDNALTLILNMEFLENHLNELKKLPFIKVHPTDPTKQKATVAAKQYHDYLQSYNNMNVMLIRLMNYSALSGEEKDELTEGMKLLNEYIDARKQQLFR